MSLGFSIICPSYNSKNTITDTVSSIIQQSYGDWELIIVDDGSIDGSREIIQSLSINDKRIRIFEQTNSGPYEARRFGVNNAVKDIVMFIDSDDKYCSNALKTLAYLFSEYDVDAIEFSHSSKENDYYSGNIRTILEGDNINRYYFLPPFPSQLIWNKAFKRSVYIQSDEYINIKTGDDFLFIKNFIPNCKKILFIDDVLYYYNMDDYSHRSDNYLSNLYTDTTFIGLWGTFYYLIVDKMDSMSKKKYLVQMLYYLFETVKNVSVTNSFFQTLRKLKHLRNEKFSNIVLKEIKEKRTNFKQYYLLLSFDLRLFAFVTILSKLKAKRHNY